MKEVSLNIKNQVWLLKGGLESPGRHCLAQLNANSQAHYILPLIRSETDSVEINPRSVI